MNRYVIRYYWTYPGEPDRVGVTTREVEAKSVSDAYSEFDQVPQSHCLNCRRGDEMPTGANFLNWVVFAPGGTEPLTSEDEEVAEQVPA